MSIIPKLPSWVSGTLSVSGSTISSSFVPALAQCPLGAGNLYLFAVTSVNGVNQLTQYSYAAGTAKGYNENGWTCDGPVQFTNGNAVQPSSGPAVFAAGNTLYLAWVGETWSPGIGGVLMASQSLVKDRIANDGWTWIDTNGLQAYASYGLGLIASGATSPAITFFYGWSNNQVAMQTGTLDGDAMSWLRGGTIYSQSNGSQNPLAKLGLAGGILGGLPAAIFVGTGGHVDWVSYDASNASQPFSTGAVKAHTKEDWFALVVESATGAPGLATFYTQGKKTQDVGVLLYPNGTHLDASYYQNGHWYGVQTINVNSIGSGAAVGLYAQGPTKVQAFGVYPTAQSQLALVYADMPV